MNKSFDRLSFGAVVSAVLILLLVLLILTVLTALIVLLILTVLLVLSVLLLTVIILIRHSNTSFLRASFRHPFRKYYNRTSC